MELQFVYPRLLWALIALIIPIIIHLFQLRKFRKEAFTNVALLKKIEIQSRKSNRLKKWLLFSIRLLAFTAIILAFAEPYGAPKKTTSNLPEWVIYLDNSFSMQAPRGTTNLLGIAVEELIENIPGDFSFTLVTNDRTFSKTTLNELKKDLRALSPSPYKQTTNNALLKGVAALKATEGKGGRLIVVSDFQQHENNITVSNDSLIEITLAPVRTQHPANIGIDSLYIAERRPDGYTLTAVLSRQGDVGGALPVSLFSDGILIAKATATFSNSPFAEVSFQLSPEGVPKGRIALGETNGLPFDDALYFSLNPQEKIRVLAVNEADGLFLQRLYSGTEFIFTSFSLPTLSYNDIPNQNLIILNELKTIPTPLLFALQSFQNKGGTLVIIPPKKATLSSYNQLLTGLQVGKLNEERFEPRKVMSISYHHPLYKNVFEKQVQNFQYPNVQSYYPYEGNASPILRLDNADAFLVERNRVYLFTASLQEDESDFKKSPLIVPLYYNMAKYSFQFPQLYYTIGDANRFEVKTTLPKDGIVSLWRENMSFIPQQQAFDARVALTTIEQPLEAGVYEIRSEGSALGYAAFNYDRSENRLNYHGISNIMGVDGVASLGETLGKLKNEGKVNPLWRAFVIFALALLLLEWLLLKLFK